MLGEARSLRDLGQHFGADLYEAEVRYHMDREFATTANDVLWRRTKLALILNDQEQAGLEAFVGTGGEPAFSRAAE